MARHLATKEFRFEAAHRLINYVGKCAHLHGHSYRVLVTFSSSTLNDKGMVIDFSDLKKTVGWWIDEHFDHATIIHADDAKLGSWLADNTQKTFRLQCNPTAENIAMEIYRVSARVASNYGVTIDKVKIYETPTCSATYRTHSAS